MMKDVLAKIPRLANAAFAVLVLAYLIVPVLIVIPMAFNSSRYLTFPPPGFSLQYFNEIFFGSVERIGGKATREWSNALWNTLSIGATTSVVSTVLGTLAAIGLVRARISGKAAIGAFMISPLIIPQIITAIALYFLYIRLDLIGTFAGMVIAHTVLATPFVFIVTAAALQGFDWNLMRAAESLGAPPLIGGVTVLVPVLMPAIVTGALFAFITSFDEVVVALFLSGAGYRTLPVVMFEGIRFEIDPAIAAVGTLMIMLAMAVLVAAEILRRRAEKLRTRH